LKIKDWNIYVQVVWVQDFPKSKETKSNEFKETLIDFWKQCTNGLSCKWLDSFDFSNASVDLVPSVPGFHKSENRQKYGHLRLRSLLERNKVHSSKMLYCQASSIGRIYDNWLAEILESFKCEKTNFNLVFPSLDTVSKSMYRILILL
jgi:tyrosyl-DNA phosphodiesterase 1